MPTSARLPFRAFMPVIAAVLLSGLLVGVERPSRSRAPTTPVPEVHTADTAREPEVQEPVDPGFSRIQTSVGPVLIARGEVSLGTPKDLVALVRAARAAGLRATEGEPWKLGTSQAGGAFLRDTEDQTRVLRDAVLRREEVAARDGEGERLALAQATARLTAAPGEGLEPGSGVALRDVLRRLELPDQDPDSTELNPGVARLTVAGGWLADAVPNADPSRREAVEQALDVAMAFRPQAVWTSDDGSHVLADVSDAWVVTGEVYRAPDRTVMVVRPPLPMDDGNRTDAVAACRTTIELPAGCDPAEDPAVVAEARRAKLTFEGRELLTWSLEEGMQADVKAWREVFPAPKGIKARDGFPPHLVLVGFDGTVGGLVVAQGVLRPVRNGSNEEAERFLADAARLLPDVAHLDLIQQYLMKWVHDSPDPTRPLAIGCREANGDIHQTAQEVLATVAGGIARGDCDDFAELAWTIARRQGRLAHTVSVPGHLATAWAEKRDEKWHFFVVQTGPALEVRDRNLARAVYRGYTWFDDTQPVDPDALPVSLRFAEDSKRGRYRLSWRIFEDEDYASAMIDIQENWHDSTLLQGNRKIRALIQNGDHDPSNYAELAALYSQTGQFDEAVATYRKAAERARDPEGRTHRMLDVFGQLLMAGRNDEAATLADEIIENDLPKVAARWGARTARVEIDLASALANRGAPRQAARILAGTVHRRLLKEGPSLATYAGNALPDEAWGRSWERRRRVGLLHEAAKAAMVILRRLDATDEIDEHVRAAEAYLAKWLRHIAFTRLEDRDDVLGRWGCYGWLLEYRNPKGFLDRLAEAPFPEPVKEDAHQALAAATEESALLSWVRANPYTFTGRLAELIEKRAQRPDPVRVHRLGVLLEESFAAARRLGYDVKHTNRTIHSARLLVALLTGDIDALRGLFRRVHRAGDTRLRDRTAYTLGHTASHLDMDVWQKVVACWVDEIDSQPNYYHIAWTAACYEAPAHALFVADLAAERFASDPAFVEEARYMHELLDG